MHTQLQKIKVLDFSHLLPGELCSLILSDLGCAVVRLESLEAGLAQNLPPIIKGESVYYWSMHRNQKRLALDLKSPQGLEIVQQLVKQSDVLIQNFRPGVMDRLGLGYEQLKESNGGLVYCSISGYGHNSSWSQRPGHDLNFVAEAGIIDLNRSDDATPVLPSVLVSDFTASIYAALAIVSALLERDQTGQGRHLDISMYECALSTMSILATRLLYTGMHPGDGRFAVPSQLPNYNVYRCADNRYLAVASLEPKFWQTFCERLNIMEHSQRSPDGPDPQLRQKIAGIISQKTLQQWLEVFEGSDCCVSPVNTLEEALQFPPTTERGVMTSILHPVLGKVPQMATPLTFGDLSEKQQAANADRAQCTMDMLKDLGYSRKQIEELLAAGVIARPQEMPAK